MRYFQATSHGTISHSQVLVSWLWWDRYHIAYRTTREETHFLPHPSALPNTREYGCYTEITEQEARQLDPELFKLGITWEDYERFKVHDHECEIRLGNNQKRKGK